MKVVSIPSTITQVDMSNVHTYNNSIRRLEKARDAVLDSILRRYEAGAAIEPGVFDLEVIERVEGGKKTVAVKIR